MPLVLVLFEPVRSADPPIVAGIAALIASSAISDALRVATVGGLAIRLSMYGLSQLSSALPAILALNSSALPLALSRSFHSACAPAPRWPASRHAASTSPGISNG